MTLSNKTAHLFIAFYLCEIMPILSWIIFWRQNMCLETTYSGVGL